MVFVRPLVAGETDIAIDALYAVVRSGIHLQMRAQRAELRAELDNEFPRRLEQLLVIVRPVLGDPVLAVVSTQCREKSSRTLWEPILHRADSCEWWRYPATSQ